MSHNLLKYRHALAFQSLVSLGPHNLLRIVLWVRPVVQVHEHEMYALLAEQSVRNDLWALACVQLLHNVFEYMIERAMVEVVVVAVLVVVETILVDEMAVSKEAVV